MPIKYIPFIPEPVEGQAVLGNFNRILRYKGADELSMTLQRGMPLYEMEKQETVGENTGGNMVIRGECVSACAYLKEQGIQVDLVYIDPPFASGADYAKKVYIRRNPKVAEVIAQAERELDVDELKAFEEKMYGDVWDKEKYLSWMYENLMAIKGVMSEPASIYVHLDYHIGHLYDHIDIIQAPNKKRHFELGSDITITANNHHFNVNYKFQGTLQEQIREIKLISAMMQKQPIYIGKVLMPVFSSLDFHGHTLDEVSNRLSALLRADATLKKLHVQKDLSLGSLTDKETSNLNYLVDGILDGSTVPLKCSEQSSVGKISIGNISLLLVLKKADNETGCFIRNFFEIDDLVLAGKDASPEHGTRVSPYVLVTAEQLETIDNVDLSEIVPSIQKQPYSAVYGEHILFLILELLKLYDRRKDTTILDIVIQLLDFLSEKDASQVDLYQINRLQTEKRRRKLNPEEIQYLSSMKSKGIPAQYQLAANILLESFYEAQLIYDQLCPEEKEVFASYPIINLWKSKG